MYTTVLFNQHHKMKMFNNSNNINDKNYLLTFLLSYLLHKVLQQTAKTYVITDAFFGSFKSATGCNR